MKIHFEDICAEYGVTARPKFLNQSADPAGAGFKKSWRALLPVIFSDGREVVGEGNDDSPIEAIKIAFRDAIRRYLLRYTPEKIDLLTGEILETAR
ncbi:MAG: hypothetical protein WCO18_01270 [bacterium]